MKKWTFVLALLVVALVSCKSMKEGKDTTESLDFEVIQSGVLMGAGAEGIEQSLLVLNSESELNEIKEKMNSVNYSTEALDKINVDFEKETIIGYFDAVRSSGGYALGANYLKRIKTKEETKLVMSYTLTSPQGAATMALTQPYHFIKTEKIAGKVELIVEGTDSL
jgi:hypothetical protein